MNGLLDLWLRYAEVVRFQKAAAGDRDLERLERLVRERGALERELSGADPREAVERSDHLRPVLEQAERDDRAYRSRLREIRDEAASRLAGDTADPRLPAAARAAGTMRDPPRERRLDVRC